MVLNELMDFYKGQKRAGDDITDGSLKQVRVLKEAVRGVFDKYVTDLKT